MAISAHIVPVLVGPRPVNCIVMDDFFIWVEVKPALAALTFRTAIPCQCPGPAAAARKLNKILLERIYAKCLFYFIIVQLPIGAICADYGSAVALIELGPNSKIIKFSTIKQTNDTLRMYCHCERSEAISNRGLLRPTKLAPQ